MDDVLRQLPVIAPGCERLSRKSVQNEREPSRKMHSTLHSTLHNIKHNMLHSKHSSKLHNEQQLNTILFTPSRGG